MKRTGVVLALLAAALVLGAAAAAETITGIIDGGDPTRPNTVFDNTTASTCAAAKPYPGTLAVPGEGYDTYTRTNSAGTVQCYTFQLDNAAGGSTDCLLNPAARCPYSEVYSSFNPNNAATGYLGDIGSPVTPGGSRSYSVRIAAGASFTIVVEEYNPGAGTNTYTLTITSTSVPTAVTLRSLSAARTQSGVRVRWSVASAPATLGFDVFRLTGHARTRVNSHLVAARSKPGASSYSVLDRGAPGAARVRYEIDAVGLDGTRAFLGVTALSAA